MSNQNNVKVCVQMTTMITIDPAAIGIDPVGDREANQASLNRFLKSCMNDSGNWDAKVEASPEVKINYTGSVTY